MRGSLKMEDNTVHMGGILDLATTHPDDIFNMKAESNEISLENNMFQTNYDNVKANEIWNDYGGDGYNKEILDNPEDSIDDFIKISGNDNKQKQKTIIQPSELPLHTSGPMIWSISSSVAETPGDSGVQCLDSETSDLTGDCPVGMTHSLVEAEELLCDPTSETQNKESPYEGEVSHIKNIHHYLTDDIMTQSDIENQNTCSIGVLNNNLNGSDKKSALKNPLLADEDNSSPSTSCKQKGLETMKSASDDIVYRRKCKKKSGDKSSQPKKRVSFHEDILNNTKTDNIHIEHGFISYRPEAAMNYFSNSYLKKINTAIGRYSWCTVGDSPYDETHKYASSRNARSDVLTYGGTDVVGYPDNSGIYEYQTDNKYFNLSKSCDSETCVNKIPPCKCSREDSQKSENNSPENQRQLYMCSCSSSDSNLSSESDTSSQTLSLNSDTKINSGPSKKCDNTKKSYSCDCIENNSMKPLTNIKTMYFSEANINHSDKREEQLQMSEVLPKASCLKKSALKKKRYITTNVIEEHESTLRRKSYNEKSRMSLLDSKNLFGSLKNIYKNINFGLSIAERGVPEGSEDCQSVSDVLETDALRSDKSNASKTFDSDLDLTYTSRRTVGDGLSSNFMQEIDDREDNYGDPQGSCIGGASSINKKQFDVSKQNLSLDMNASNGKTFLDWKSHGDLGCNKDVHQGSKWLRNKCIVNCESTVYEHKGVSYCYEYDTFQTTFDTSKDTFTPITDTITSMNRSVVKIENIKESENTITTEEPPIEPAKDIEEYKNTHSDVTSENDSITENSEKAKFRLSKYLIEQNENGKLGISKHLSSPLRQRNIMRYEKNSKFLSCTNDGKENEPNFDSNSTQDTLNESADLDEIMEIGDGFEISNKPSNRKMSLINRFLKNVSQKKGLYSKLQQNEFFQQKLKEESLKFPNICFPKNERISPTFKIAAKYLDSLINKEVMENKRVSVKLMTADEPSYFDSFEENVAIECCEKLKLELFRNSSEVLQRMLKVRSSYAQDNGQWTPQLVFITNTALYVAEVETGKYTYNLLFYLTHDKLGAIVIGPDSQYVQIFDNSSDSQCTLITGDRYLCHRLVSSLEWSSRNCRIVVENKVVFGSIPSVIWKGRDCLRSPLLKTTSYDRYERCLFYGMVGSSAPASSNNGRPASPFGQAMEGFLMYKTEKQRHWKPSFFLLKSGILSYGSSTLPTSLSSSSLPHSIDLKTAIGVRRCTDIQGRPYCFEIALNVGSRHLQMAAPDEDVASQWLQGLLMHAAQALEGPKLDPSKKPLPPCCTLLVSSKHIITLREDLDVQLKFLNIDLEVKNKVKNDENVELPLAKNGLDILSFASITDLTALKIPDNDDNWCILEFVFCEVHEGTEMGFLFASSAELERFIATVESIWHKTNNGVFPISIQPGSDNTSKKCSESHNHLVTAWDKSLPAAHR